tara:strand:- start:105 stop:3503 length:3399 start_codon:yes stop_codon:yes gene_type:complete
MASVTQKVPNYVLGISTQPDEKKIPGQVVDLVNGVPDVVRQLIKRPGSQLVNTLSPSTASHTKWFDIYTTDEEQYIGQVGADGAVKIWRCSDGVEISVDYNDITGTNKATYLDNTELLDEKSSDIQVLTINETTFFVNRRKTVAMKTGASDKSPAQLNEAFINLDTISYGKQYALDIFDPTDNTTYTHTRATGIVIDEATSYSGTSNGDCLGMGRETVNISTGTDKFGTSPPNMSANGKSRLRYEVDTRCTPQPTPPVDSSYSYHDAYQPFSKLQFGGEGWTTGDTHQYTSEKGITTTITVKSHINVVSRANIVGIRPNPTSSSAEEHVSSGGILGDIKTVLDAISGHGITATVCGNGIHLYRATPFGVTTPEKTLMTITTTEANNIADLPRVCRHGYTVRVVNSGEDMDDYYLRFQAEGISADIVQTATYARAGNTVTVTAANHGLANGSEVILDFTSGGATDGYYTIQSVADANTFTVTDSVSGTIEASETVTIHPARFGEGVWEEVAAPGITTTFDDDTMPLRLTRVLPSTQYTIPTSAVNTGNDQITIANHGMVTGNAVLYDNGGGTALAGLTDDTAYYVRRIDANTIALAPTAELAASGALMDLTGTGNNAQTLTLGYFSINGAANTHHPNGAFRFSYPPWGQRDVGDDVTNSEPSFVGNTIQKMVFYRNRIALLSEANLILSRVNQFYHFWVKTAMAISNADPIDLQSSSTFPTKLYDAVESNAGLVIFSASEQFLLSSGAEALLTPETAKIAYLSSYAFNPDTQPISLGTTLGFLNSTAKNARFYEMASIQANTEPEVQEQSKIIARLFPNNISMVTGSTENNLLLYGIDSTLHTASNEVWGYKWFQAGDKRAQSAWFRWTLPNNVVFHTILDDVYYAVLQNGSDYTLEKFDVKLTLGTPMLGTAPDDNRVHLDTKKTIASSALTYNTAADTTTFTLGAGFYSTRTLTVYCTTDSDAAGKSYDVQAADISGSNPNKVITLPGNWKTSLKDGVSVNTDLIVGYEYEFEVELPKLYMVRDEGGKVRSETRGSLVIHRMNFDFGDVGVIDVTLKRRGRDDYTYTVESLEWDNINASTPAIADGYNHTIPVYDRNVNLSVLIKSNHPSPATVHSMNWEGDYSPRYYQRV